MAKILPVHRLVVAAQKPISESELEWPEWLFCIKKIRKQNKK